MDDVVKLLASPVFWVGTVIVGIAINIVSRYIQTPIDNFFSSISSAWRRRSERSRAAYAARVNAHLDDPYGQVELHEQELRSTLMAVLYLIMVVITGLVVVIPSDSKPGYMFIALAAFFILFCLGNVWVAGDAKALLKAVREESRRRQKIPRKIGDPEST